MDARGNKPEHPIKSKAEMLIGWADCGYWGGKTIHSAHIFLMLR